MRKTLLWIFMLMLIPMLLLAGCGDKSPASGKASSEASKGAASEAPKGISDNNGTSTDISSSSGTDKDDDIMLPDNYPIEILPLAADAEILDVRENPANKGLEVMYVSDNNIDTLCEYYEGALKESKNLITTEMPDGYMITAKLNGLDYSIMISKDAMKPNPKYSEKISVYIILTGLESISAGVPQMPEGDGEVWPSADLPGIPQLKGHIDQILREDGIIRLEMTVENAEIVKNYIDELTAAGFSFDTHPDKESDHMEFLAFKGSGMMSFAYKGEENLVSIEYQK